MRKDEKGREWPYCRLCSKWAEPSHLTSNGCRKKVTEYTTRHDDNIGPLLQEILTALDKKREQRQNKAGVTDGAGRGLSSESEEGIDASSKAHGTICSGRRQQQQQPQQQQRQSVHLSELQYQQHM